MANVKKQNTELENSDVLRRMQMVRASPNPTGPEGNGSFLYALYVFDVFEGRVLRQFGFDIPPQSIQMQETMAGTVAAGQEGGYWSDDRGQYFKDLTVRGQFGFRPTPKREVNNLGTLGQSAQRSVNQLNEVSGRFSNNVLAGVPKAPEGEVTGQDRLRMLTNIFRLYGDRKRTRDTAPGTIMIWADYKSGEVYVAQPVNFMRDRSVPNGSIKTAYSFQLRLLEMLKVKVTEDFLMSPRSRNGRRMWLDKLKEAAATMNAARSVLEQTVDGALDFGFDIVSTIFRPVTEAIEMARTIIDSGEAIARAPLELLRGAHRNCLEVIAIMGSDTRYRQVAKDYKRLARAIASSFTPLKIFSSQDVNAPAQALADRYAQRFGIPENVNDATPSRRNANTDSSGFILGGSIPAGNKREKVPRFTDIKGVAVRYLGKAGRWKEIALLNGLSSPYISPEGDGVTVLRPGDPILIPADPEEGDGQIVNLFDGINEPEGFDFGTDLLIDPNTRSFVVDENGDLAVVSGLNNLQQAGTIKTFTKPSDLVAHPWFGFSGEVGRGLTIDMLAQQHLELKMTLESDSRVEKILELSMRGTGDKLEIRGIILAKNKTDQVALTNYIPTGAN